MTVRDAQQLITKLQRDPNLRQQFHDAGESAFSQLAKQNGFNVTANDMHQALQDVNVSTLRNLRPQLPGGGTTAIVAIASVAVI
jgi:predicted ribosomally synthesized peptide with nif11-like leader